MTQGRKILFVDDEPMILSALKRETRDWFEEAELEFLEADSVDKALALLEKTPQDFLVVVSDLKMPQKKGNVLLGEVLRRWPLISTILLTGFSEMEDIKACIRSGIISFIQKPWDSDFLKAEVLRGVDTARMKFERLEHQKQMEAELSWAKKINQALLMPKALATSTIEAGLAYRAHSSSACGGDFFSMTPMGKDGMVVCLGDVAVEGVKGTYFALLIREELNSILAELTARQHFNPGEVLEQLNNRILELKLDLPGTVMTMSVLAILPGERRLVYACAGGDEFLLVRNRQIHRFHLPSPGLGYQRDLIFTPKALELEFDDLLVLSSDGITQAPGKTQELQELSFGMDPSWPAQTLADKALSMLEAGLMTGFADDATIIILKYR